ncbi:hypothetical protein VC83_01908 [Pseudogymnoascus destructans]|uniref:ribonuclease H n=1 Tax=Pseudogymnoascus destructans TaxID=655981 RepID=A0A177AHG8_9PEZI|nr:uncharacterized protein VC83_01908 [Pseudogymnoascus destructans]OAF61240.1 hypothetical protein VC83_01908 [Pseudogymnoascus destructans]
MKIYVDGGCRENGTPGAYGAAAVVVKSRTGAVINSYGDFIPQDSRPTNQRAELMAIIRGLVMAINRNSDLQNRPSIDIKIHSDSRYAAVNCMTDWKHVWLGNGWRTSEGLPVLNQDLTRQAHQLIRSTPNFEASGR